MVSGSRLYNCVQSWSVCVNTHNYHSMYFKSKEKYISECATAQATVSHHNGLVCQLAESVSFAEYKRLPYIFSWRLASVWFVLSAAIQLAKFFFQLIVFFLGSIYHELCRCYVVFRGSLEPIFFPAENLSWHIFAIEKKRYVLCRLLYLLSNCETCWIFKLD